MTNTTTFVNTFERNVDCVHGDRFLTYVSDKGSVVMIPGENLRIATDLFGKINAEQIVKGRPEIETVAKSTVVTSGSLLDLRIGDKEVSTKTFLNIFGYPEKVVVRYGDDELTITWSPVGKGTVTERCESSRKAV